MPDDRYDDRVRRGAALLDRVHPGWAAKISEAELDLASCDKCLLGQIYGHFESGYRSVLRPLITRKMVVSMDYLTLASDHGFTLTDREQAIDRDGSRAVLDRFSALTDAWRAEIRRRTGPAATT